MWDGKTPSGWQEIAESAYAIINLAGDNISQGRWNKKKKEKILSSRLDAGSAISKAVENCSVPPGVVIQSSAIGYYGNRGEEVLDEKSTLGIGFMAQVAKQWEDSTKSVESHGVRRCIIRTCIVLGKDGGFLDKLKLPFRFFAGGWMGSGMQWISWVHLDDEVTAILHLIEREDLSGPFNLGSPEPLRNRDFSRELGKAMRRPCWLPVPAFLLKLVFGELATELILASQRVRPARLLESGFKFRHEKASQAIRNSI